MKGSLRGACRASRSAVFEGPTSECSTRVLAEPSQQSRAPLQRPAETLTSNLMDQPRHASAAGSHVPFILSANRLPITGLPARQERPCNTQAFILPSEPGGWTDHRIRRPVWSEPDQRTSATFNLDFAAASQLRCRDRAISDGHRS
jgi:hypothetical protein